MSKQHAKLSPSAAERWINCPGSVKLLEGIESKSSEYAMEGTAAHEMAEIALTKKVDPYTLVGLESKDAPGYFFTEVMAGYVSEYVDLCNEIADGADFVEVETKFEILKEFDMFGTSDFSAIRGETMFVVDLKYGMGVGVKAEGNKQAMLYALGMYKLIGEMWDVKDIEIVISQPRKESVSRWGFSVKELLSFEKEIKKAAKIALDPKAKDCNTGSWCRFCDAKTECPAMHAKAVAVAKEEFDDGLDSPYSKYIEVWRDKDAILEYLNAVEEFLSEKIQAGEEIPGLKMVEGRKGNESWDDEESVAMFLDELGDDLYKKSIITPTQAKKLIKSKKLDINIDGMTYRKDGKPTLVDESDKRIALNFEKAIDAFKD